MPDKRIVNLKSPSAITVLSPSVSGEVKGVELSTAQIRTCLVDGVRVEEIIGGKVVRLTLSNYKDVAKEADKAAKAALKAKEEEEAARLKKEEEEKAAQEKKAAEEEAARVKAEEEKKAAEAKKKEDLEKARKEAAAKKAKAEADKTAKEETPAE